MTDKMNNGVSSTPEHVVPPESFGFLKDSRFANHFTYHAPNKNQVPRYNAINEAAKKFAEVVCANVPASADQSAALRKIVETKMTCNSFIATNPELFK